MTFDVTKRLADGLGAVDNLQTYVWACAIRGFHHPDLTLHGAQVRDWYGTEDGLDLHALEADGVTLRAAALALGQVRFPGLDGVWSGEGGSAASAFVDRHVSQAAALVAAVDAASAVCLQLRDTLWHAVDRKVDATAAIDDRTASQRPEWLAAARSVVAGQTSEEAGAVVDGQIMPFVSMAVGDDWVTAMRTSTTAVAAAYRAAVDALAGRPVVRFDIPGDFGPSVVTPAVAGAGSVAPVLPAAAPVAVPAGSAPLHSATAPAGESVLPEPVAAQENPQVPSSALAPPPGLPPAGGPTMPDATPGVGGLADTLGGLFEPGSTSPGAPPTPPDVGAEPPGPGDATVPGESKDPEGDEPDLDELRERVLDAAEDVAVDDDPEPAAPEVSEPTPETSEPHVESLPAPEVTEEVPPPPPPAPPADPVATPCEIAADELPQVGQ